MNLLNTKKLTWTLGGVLTVQLVLVAILQWSEWQGVDSKPATPLLATESKAVNKIEISDGKQSVVLHKINDSWQLPELYQLPADGFKVSELISQLKRNKTQWPVATSKSAKTRFEVAEDKYKRRIKIWSGDKVVSDVFVGTSPAFRQSHVRRAGEDEIYAVEINSYSINLVDSDWLDKNLLQVKSFDTFESDSLSLKQHDAKWQLVAAKGLDKLPSAVKDDELQRLQTKLSSLRVLDVAEKTIEKPDFRFTVRAGDKTYTYELAKLDDSYWIKRDDYPQVFKLSQMDYEYFTGLSGEKLAAVESDKDAAVANKEGEKSKTSAKDKDEVTESTEQAGS